MTAKEKALQKGRENLAEQVKLAQAWFDKLPTRDIDTFHMLFHEPRPVLMRVMAQDPELANIFHNLAQLSFGLLASEWVTAHDRQKAKNLEAPVSAEVKQDTSN